MKRWKPAIGAVIAALVVVTFGVVLTAGAAPAKHPDPIRPADPVAVFTPREPDESPPPRPTPTESCSPAPNGVGPDGVCPACANCF